MFGFTTVVVGNMPNTKLAAAITAAQEQDGNKIDRTEIIRVYEWAWLGDWIKQVLSIREALDSDPDADFDELTAEFPQLPRYGMNGEDGSFHAIVGAEQPDVFHLGIGYAMERGLSEINREWCAHVATESLIRDKDDDCRLVYGVVLTEATYAKQNSRIMLDELSKIQGNNFWADMLNFKIRVFVVKDDGSVEMHKLK